MPSIITEEEYLIKQNQLINELRQILNNKPEDMEELIKIVESKLKDHEEFQLEVNIKEILNDCNFGISGDGDGWKLTFENEKFIPLNNIMKVIVLKMVETNLILQYEFGGDFGETYQMQMNLIKDLLSKYSL